MSSTSISGKQEKKSKAITCVVTSDKMSKSRVGIVERIVKEPTFGKYLRRSTKLMFHDENNETKIGDKVMIETTKPLSAKKRFRLLKIVERAKGIVMDATLAEETV